ncbi:nad dependent epimerase [Phlyctema vagabunda]|uniref:Nad dependent epimerase n=1 Tax=Phlyctema vagabunda TaxID=108571 RepID=A0ABR4P402_9HELO
MSFSKQYTPKPITDIFTPKDTDINRRELRRTVPMRVLMLGLGRTGTSSLRAAMKDLGYEDTYHMMSCSIENPPDALLWRDAFAAKFDNGPAFTRADWDQLLGHCQAVCDWPAVAFAEELIEAYPEAKVVMTTRDVHSWHASTMKTVYWRVSDPELRWLSYFSWAAGLYYPMLKKFFDEFFKGDFPGQGKQIFTAHYEHVRTLVPPERLLEFNIKDGWEPLCKFLEEPVPKGVKFPHVNDNSDFVSRSKTRNRNQIKNVLFRYALIAVATVALWYLFAWLMQLYGGYVQVDFLPIFGSSVSSL